MYNSTVFNKLRPNQELFLVRYSQTPTPDFIKVIFKGYSENNQTVEFINKDDVKQKLKKFPVKKSEYRLFIDEMEMAKSLMDCFVRRQVKMNSSVIELVERSQNTKPEIWI
ncbi:MAG: hypothetical protein DRH57_07235 [Candidatus Cloacimonadota bacterium]|nr:MAG: hypothetical protein DRH57_07235 [Candidatus Cloacimonadota bacterium]